MKPLFITFLALGLSACATQPSPEVDAGAETSAEQLMAEPDSARSADNSSPSPGDDGVICERRKEIGTNRRTRVCYTRAEKEAIEEESRRQLERSGPN